MKQPKIRFKGFSGEWETPIVSEVFDIRNGYTPSKNVKEFWEGGTIPWFRMEDIRENGGILRDSIQHITPIGVKGNGLFEKNSIILATTATIGVHAMLIADSLANQRFTNFSIRKSLSDKYFSYFVYYAFYRIDEWSKMNTNSGGLLSVNIPLLLKQPFYTPSIREQKVITSYFTNLDSLIQSTAKKIDSLKQVKAASLQSMFPQEGETTPRVRFKGFEGEWEIVPFAKVFSFVKNNSFTRDQLSVSEGEVKNVHYGDVLIKFGDIIDGKKDCLPYIIGLKQSNKLCQTALLRDGDIIIADAAEDNTVGKCSEMFNINNEYVLSGLHTIACRPLIIFALGYLGHYMNTDSYHNQLLPLIQGSKISSISKSAILQTTIMFPSYAEQQQIASYFTALDSQISLHSQRLEKLKQIKSACLDNMFV